ncbi:MAG: ABC transporter substrate-binding protein [Endomicrobium sp.]|jgi:NitT/TauT family transport system substrate-binding protein|nr:ABC transporter substrate-binding protein [Endomicrobium sp.]
MKKGFLIFLALSFTLSASACADKKGRQEEYQKKFPLGKTKIRALSETSSAVCGSPIFIAYEKGFFAEEGIDVELVAGDDKVTKAGLQNNEFPIASEDFGYLINIYQGLDIKVIAGAHKGCIKLLAAPDSPYNSAADLKQIKGRKIKIAVCQASGKAVSVGANHIFASIVLKRTGIDLKDVEWFVLPADSYDFRHENNIDAFVLRDISAVLAVKKEGYKLLSDQFSDSDLNNAYCCFLYAPSKLVKEKPKLIKGLLKAYRKAANYIADNPQKAAELDIDKKYVSADQKEIIGDLLISYDYGDGHNNGKKARSAKDDLIFYVEEIKALGYLPASLNTKEFVEKAYFDNTR